MLLGLHVRLECFCSHVIGLDQVGHLGDGSPHCLKGKAIVV